MIPILYNSSETEFASNGIGRLRDASSCVASETRNGPFELELTYPIAGRLFNEIVPGKIIGAIHDDNHDVQPFEIYRCVANLDGTATFNARHISYRLSDALATPFSAESLAGALSGIEDHAINLGGFSFLTDKSSSSPFSISGPRSVRSALLGEEGSILDVYGGEYQFDKFDVHLYQARGRDTGVTIRYGKNMTGLELEIDSSELFNAVAPFVTDGETVVYLPEFYVQPTTPPSSPLKIRTMDFGEYFEVTPTEEQLRSKAKEWIDSVQPWLPSENLKVSFIPLWKTMEYQDLASILRVGLCDTVSIYYTDLGVIAEKQKVVKIDYNVLTEQMISLEVGKLPTQFVAITSDEGTGESTGLITELVTGPSKSVAGGGNHSGSFSVEKSGYRPIAISGFTTNASTGCVARMDLEPGEATVYFNVRNVGGSNQTLIPAARIVYAKI